MKNNHRFWVNVFLKCWFEATSSFFRCFFLSIFICFLCWSVWSNDENFICLMIALWEAIKDISSVLAIVSVKSPPNGFINEIVWDFYIFAICLIMGPYFFFDINFLEFIIRVNIQFNVSSTMTKIKRSIKFSLESVKSRLIRFFSSFSSCIKNLLTSLFNILFSCSKSSCLFRFLFFVDFLNSSVSVSNCFFVIVFFFLIPIKQV